MTLSFIHVSGWLVGAIALHISASEILAQAVPDEFVVRLERTACFGECPVYTVSIDAKGNVTYEGDRFVRVAGRQTDRIPISSVAALFETAERIGFFELRDEYRTIRNPDGTFTMVTDLPTAFVTVTRGGRPKRVEDYIGAPDGLEQFEKQIDEAARTRRWIRIDEPMVRQLVREGWSPSVEERGELLRNALQYDDVDVLKALIEIGADPNALLYRTKTPPLMMVRSAAAARTLLEAGAVPFTRNSNGETALAWAVNLAPEVTEVLLKAGVPVDHPSRLDGRTPLWQAACRGNAGAAALLLRAGADPAIRSRAASAVECARRSKEFARSRPQSVFRGKPAFVEDFDGVIALLEQALAKRKQL